MENNSTSVLSTLVVDAIMPVVLGLGAWVLSTVLDYDHFQELVATSAGVTIGLLISRLYQLGTHRDKTNRNIALLSSTIEAAEEKHDIVTRTNNLQTHLLKALKTEGLPKELLLRQLHYFEALVEEAARGRLNVKFEYDSFMNYTDFFGAAKAKATMKATALVLASDEYRQIVLEENRKFIQKGGHVKRVFIIPKKKDVAQAWQKYIEEHKKVGVDVSYVFAENLKEPPRDILVLDNPKIASEATPAGVGGKYEKVVFISDPIEVDHIEKYWNTVNVHALPCTTDDCLEMALQKSGVI